MEEFISPTRQSIFAIVLIIQKFVKIIFTQLWPVVLIIFIGGGQSGRGRAFLGFIIVFAVLSMLFAIASYFRYFFFIQNDELTIHKGILQTTKLNIPFDRIQSVNFQQSLLHRLFDVVKVEIDTAGSMGKELALDAISKDKAYRLRDIILQRKEELGPISMDLENLVEPVSKQESLIFKLPIAQLLKVGITQNHLTSGGLIFGAFFWIASQLDDAGMDVEEYVQDNIDKFQLPGMNTVVAVIILFVVASLIISMLRTIFTYFNLRLYRTDNKYRLVSGLLTRRETSATNQKIQVMEWSHNALMKLIGFNNIRLKQASSIAVNDKKSITIPGCQMEQVQLVKQNWIGQNIDTEIDTTSVSIHFFYRRLFFSVLLAVGICALLFKTPYFYMSIFLIPFMALISFLSYKKRSFGITDEILLIKSGIFGRHSSLMPLHKVQSVSLRRTPYEWRRDLATVQVLSASGKLTIPFVPLVDAKKLRDYILYKVETDSRNWM